MSETYIMAFQKIVQGLS